jgi:hypothetical protein
MQFLERKLSGSLRVLLIPGDALVEIGAAGR